MRSIILVHDRGVLTAGILVSYDAGERHRFFFMALFTHIVRRKDASTSQGGKLNEEQRLVTRDEA